MDKDHRINLQVVLEELIRKTSCWILLYVAYLFPVEKRFVDLLGYHIADGRHAQRLQAASRRESTPE